ncbi:ribosome assembly [Thecaphora frezii]
MATQIPQRSAKRQRLLDKAAEAQANAMAADGKLGPSTDTLVIQFQSGQDGSLMGPAINLPAATTGQRELQMILNQLRRQLKQAHPHLHNHDDNDDDDDDDDLPYAFHVDLQHYQNRHQPLPAAAEELVKSNNRLPINESIAADILNAQAAKKLGMSQEETLTVVFEPQAVFKVRPVSRCSSTLSGHASPILCSTFSPTASLLVTGAGDKTARIWDLDTETPMHTLVGHSGWVLCAEWEGRERKLATGGMEGDVWVWEALDANFTGRKGWATRTGKQVDEERAAAEAATAGVKTDEADEAEGETQTKKKMSVAERRAARHAAPPGKQLRGHTKWITSLSWEPVHVNATAPRLASSSKDATVRVWNVALRRCEYVLGGHTASVNCVKWGGEGAIYTASSDRTVKVWSADGGKLIRNLSEHAHWVNTIALSTDFALRTGPFDHRGRAAVERDQGEGATPSYAQPTDQEAKAAALKRYQEATANGAKPELIMTGSDDHTLFLWPAQISGSAATPKKPTARLTGHQKTVNHVVFSPDGTMVASASFDNSIKLWNARTGAFIATLRGHVASVYRLAWSSDSRLLVSASKDSTLKLWDPIKTFKIKNDLPGHTDEVYCVDFAADKVASGGRDRVVKIWKH